MGVILGLAAALLYGSSDFSGGVSSRTLGFLRVSVVASAVATVLAGIVLAGIVLPAIVLMAASGSMRGSLGAGLKDGLAAGVAFGLLCVGLAQAGRHDGLWPVVSAQASELLIILVVAVRSREPLRVPVRAAGLPVLAGVSGMTATLLYFYATHVSLLATAAVIVSLYPAVTVLGARMILHERFSPVQRAGLGLCTLAVIAIALN